MALRLSAIHDINVLDNVTYHRYLYKSLNLNSTSTLVLTRDWTTAMKILLVLLSIAALSSANLQLKTEWESWKREHGKFYADDLEESLRHAIWFQNYHYIEQHNRREAFKLSLNEFGDLV